MKDPFNQHKETWPFVAFLFGPQAMCLSVSVPLIGLNVKENLIFRLIFSDSFVYSLGNGI